DAVRVGLEDFWKEQPTWHQPSQLQSL
ncbi:class Ib ribonucleoside-diphosphate reductase assembly flavoprotein NrdI, partial [Mycobacterium sp. ITM-2017-0098]